MDDKYRGKVIALVMMLGALLVGLMSRDTRGASGDRVDSSQAVDSAYNVDRQTGAFRSALATADTLTRTAILATPAFSVSNRTTITIGARFDTTGKTCQVQIVYVNKLAAATSDTDVTAYTVPATYPATGTVSRAGNIIKGYGPIVTLSGGTALYEGTYYPAPDYPFDSGRSTMARIILITAPTGGATVSLWAGS